MTQAPTLFSSDPGHIFDFADKRPAEIFNESVIPKVNSFLDLLGEDPGGLDEAKRQREARLQQDLSREAYTQQQDDSFLAGLTEQRTQARPSVDIGEYDAPLGSPAPKVGSVTQEDVALPKDLTNFVKHFEGFSPKAFGDYKQTSIGYGTRARKGETTISKEEAEKRLNEELGVARREVEQINRKANYGFTPNELDALTSFAYNVGNVSQLTAGGKRSKEEIAQKILEYNKAGGKVLPGLVKRRQAEYNLFVKGY